MVGDNSHVLNRRDGTSAALQLLLLLKTLEPDRALGLGETQVTNSEDSEEAFLVMSFDCVSAPVDMDDIPRKHRKNSVGHQQEPQHLEIRDDSEAKPVKRVSAALLWVLELVSHLLHGCNFILDVVRAFIRLGSGHILNYVVQPIVSVLDFVFN